MTSYVYRDKIIKKLSGDKMTHEEKAVANFKEGYNCSQAVVAAFSDVTGLDEKNALKISSSFGGGLGRMREVCGAVSGMAFVAGCLYGYDSPKAREEKMQHYARIQAMVNEFKNSLGSYICRELINVSPAQEISPVPEERTPQYYKKRKCLDCIATAARIMDEYIKNN